MKRVTVFEGEAVEDAQTIQESMDMDFVRVNNVEQIRTLDFGGTTEDSYAYLQWLKAQFSEQAGSLDQLSGNRAAAPTLGQSEILAANSNVRLADLQNQVHDFVGETAEDLTFFLHTDPLINLPLTRRVKGIEEQVIYTPEMRRGQFLDFTISTVPFSMVRQEPNIRVRRLLEFATAAVPAAAQAAQLLGPSFNLDKYLQNVAREVGLEDVDEWIDFEELRVCLCPSFSRR